MEKKKPSIWGCLSCLGGFIHKRTISCFSGFIWFHCLSCLVWLWFFLSFTEPSPRKVTLSLSPNPSHLAFSRSSSDTWLRQRFPKGTRGCTTRARHITRGSPSRGGARRKSFRDLKTLVQTAQRTTPFRAPKHAMFHNKKTPEIPRAPGSLRKIHRTMTPRVAGNVFRLGAQEPCLLAGRPGPARGWMASRWLTVILSGIHFLRYAAVCGGMRYDGRYGN